MPRGYSTIGIIQSRLSSTRLPYKSLLNLGNYSLTEFLLKNLSYSKTLAKIILAVPEEDFWYYQKKFGNLVNICKGSKDDVLDRYYKCAKMYEAEYIVRITGDNPLTCPKYLDEAVKEATKLKADLFHYLGIPLGTGVEVISFSALKHAWENAKQPEEREHITLYIYKNKNKFKVVEKDLKICYEKVSVDTKEDFLKVLKIVRYIGEDNFPFTVEKVVKALRYEYTHT